MGKKGYTDELERALARPDADRMCQQIKAYASYHAQSAVEWTDDFDEIITCHFENPDKALAYVVIAISQTEDAGFLALMGCGVLEDVLRDPSDELLDRIVAEARKLPRFRWLLSNPFKVAIASRAWDAIEKFRITGPNSEPSLETLPPR